MKGNEDHLHKFSLYEDHQRSVDVIKVRFCGMEKNSSYNHISMVESLRGSHLMGGVSHLNARLCSMACPTSSATEVHVTIVWYDNNDF